MKHLHNFDTVAEYEAVKDNLEIPYVVSIDESDGLQYNTDVIRVPQGSVGPGDGNIEGEYSLLNLMEGIGSLHLCQRSWPNYG